MNPKEDSERILPGDNAYALMSMETQNPDPNKVSLTESIEIKRHTHQKELEVHRKSLRAKFEIFLETIYKIARAIKKNPASLFYLEEFMEAYRETKEYVTSKKEMDILGLTEEEIVEIKYTNLIQELSRT